MKRPEITIPTLFGIMITLGGLVTGLWLMRNTTSFNTSASIDEAPTNIQITNVSDTAFSVSWVTAKATSGFVKYGDLVVSDDRDQDRGSIGSYFTHLISIRGLKASTNYKIKIGSGKSLGSESVVTTGMTLRNPPPADVIYGQIMTSGGDPAEGALIYVRLPGVVPQVALVKTSGSWVVPLSISRTSDLTSFASYDKQSADRNTVTQLVQQAIREAKNAVALNPTKVTNVENLASIYRNLLNFAQGADAWTTASYQQAIILDPTNPNLRIALGGVYFAQKNYDEAIRIFQTAVDLKPDLANAHYNLAAALREKGQYERALASLNQVMQLIEDKNSSDYQTASAETDELKKKIEPTTTPVSEKPSTPTQLTTPEKELPKPKIVPPIKVSDALAPEAPATPSAQ